MPTLWKVGLLVLVVCLLASMAIGIYRLSTTPTETFGDEFRGLPPSRTDRGEIAR